MSWQPSRRRKRNKSSPLQKNIAKKHKAVNDSDTDLTWSDIEESDSENTYFPPRPFTKNGRQIEQIGFERDR